LAVRRTVGFVAGEALNLDFSPKAEHPSRTVAISEREKENHALKWLFSLR
jgi:hypothetical protein